MNYVSLSIKELQNESIKLAIQVKQSYKPDVIIYIAKGGYLIGKEIADFLSVPCIGIYAEREGNSVKDNLAPVFRLLPIRITRMLRKIELASGLHKVVKERKVFFDAADFKMVNIKNIKKILIVDDSVDTGYSMKNVSEIIRSTFGGKISIKSASINVWSKSFGIYPVDFYIYRDSIIETPMSKDSKEYPTFMEIYNSRHLQFGYENVGCKYK